jgi:hypothetical protein
MKSQKNVVNDPRELLNKSEISIIIDDYDDIFSDFDPRPFTHRALSDDFLVEAKRASADKPTEGLELKFLLPAHERRLNTEKIIRRRLREHFIHHYHIELQEKRKIIQRGILFILAGIIFMLTTTYLLFRFHETSLGFSFLIILLEPAGWFSFWEGLNILFFESKHVNPNLEFYKKMSHIKISFWTY